YHPRVLLHRERLDNIRPRQLPDEKCFYRLIQPVGTPRHMPHRPPLVHAVTPVPPPGRIIPRRSASSRPGHGSDITAAHVTDSDPCQQPPRRRIPNVPLPCRCGPLFSAVERGLHLSPPLHRKDWLPPALGDFLALIGAYPLEFGAAHHTAQVRRHPAQRHALPASGVHVFLPRYTAFISGDTATVQLFCDP